MNKFKNSKLFFWSVELLLAFSIIFIFTKISFIFSPVAIFVSTIFVPLLISGFLYYMLNPVVNLLMKIKIWKGKHVSRTWAVILVFLAVLLVIVFLIVSFVPHLITQISNLIFSMPDFAHNQIVALKNMSSHGFLKKIHWDLLVGKAQQSFSGYLKTILSNLTSSVSAVIGMATNVVITAITVPIILFYMLKDGDKLLPSIERLFPAMSPKHKKATATLLSKMNHTLSHYIGGQMIECLFVGTFITLGYLIIGQPYALLLGVFAAVCNIIPYVGPFIGIIPSLVVVLSAGSFKAIVTRLILVLIVVVIVQQVDGNFIYPNAIGKSLDIHPLTIIIILLAAGKIAGLLGMILAIPAYAIAKVIVEYVYNIWQIQHDQKMLTFDESVKHK